MDEVEKEIAALEARLRALKASLPAHSIPPGMMAELDELDERLAQARLVLEERRRNPPGEEAPPKV